ncbi:MAG: hypothetical protein MJE66_20080 [Proteobacteria bacterium]|nr:hypothetical protein [Pseudomonadota bacterium]
MRTPTPTARWLALFAALALLPVSTAWAEANWNQERVTAIAVELAQSVKELRANARKNPDAPIGGPRRAQHAAREDLRLMENSSKHLVAQLEKGDGREETRAIYKRLQSLRRDAEENGRKARIPDDTLGKITATQDLLRRLAPYYEDVASAPPSN